MLLLATTAEQSNNGEDENPPLAPLPSNSGASSAINN
jgi:hypothetical protein